jgi:hypothetical protein
MFSGDRIPTALTFPFKSPAHPLVVLKLMAINAVADKMAVRDLDIAAVSFELILRRKSDSLLRRCFVILRRA